MNNIDVIFYINLEHRIDRNEHFLNEIKKLCEDSHKIKRIDGVINDNGILGCALSHINTIQEFINHTEWQTCLIFEDDFTFHRSNLSQNNEILECFFTNFEEWDICCLSYNPCACIYNDTHYPGVKKAIETQSACGYLLHKKFASILLDTFQKSKYHLEQGGVHSSYSPDMFWKSIQKKHNWYILKPDLGCQYDNYSNISKKQTKNIKSYEIIYYFLFLQNKLENLKKQLKSITFHKSEINKLIIIDYNSTSESLISYYDQFESDTWIDVVKIKNQYYGEYLINETDLQKNIINIIKGYYQKHNFTYFCKSNVSCLIPPIKGYFRHFMNISKFHKDKYQISGRLKIDKISNTHPEKSEIIKNQQIYRSPNIEWIVWINRIHYLLYFPVLINILTSMSIIPSQFLETLENDFKVIPGMVVARDYEITNLDWV
jgi:GR25 family glycosyltransferase involved in LPS biosynthesis